MEEVKVRSAVDGTLDVSLSGEIDYLNSPMLADRIRDAVAEGRPPQVRIDLQAVTFLDSSGLGVLVAAYRSATAVGAGYRVHGPQSVVYEQLKLAGLVELFSIEPPQAGVPRQ